MQKDNISQGAKVPLMRPHIFREHELRKCEAFSLDMATFRA